MDCEGTWCYTGRCIVGKALDVLGPQGDTAYFLVIKRDLERGRKNWGCGGGWTGVLRDP